MAQSPVVFSIFYGYPAELIARWCGVSVRTAERWKRGERKPSTTAVKLFELYRSRRVLGTEWDGWLVKDNLIVDPEGNETTQGQLRAFYIICQHYRELVRNDPDALDVFQQILRNAG